jgi:hypothetical protein
MAAIKHLDVFAYKIEDFPFAAWLEELFGAPLEKLHEVEDHQRFTRETDQSTTFHRKYYDAFEAGMKPLYLQFLADVIQPYVQDDLVYQKIPTFRVGLPNNVWVGEYHRDSWYGHPQEELNFLVPCTDMYGTKSLYIESEPDKKDFQPQTVKYGEVLHFNHTECTHGNEVNQEGTTHVSFDFRVVPYRDYRDDFSGASINSKMQFKIGGYFELLKF